MKNQKTSTFRLSIALTVLFSFFVSTISAQGVEREGKTSANASQVYLEVGGAGIIYSLNYDGRFAKLENGFGFRIGIGGASYEGDGYIAIPAQVNYLLGSKGQYLELGGGISYISISDIFDTDSGGNGEVFAAFTIGFRKQPFGKKGLTWRLAFTPFVGNGGIQPYAGASVGFRF